MGKAKEKENEIATRPVTGQMVTAASAPDFMTVDEKLGTSLVQQKIQPPFLKIIQKQSSEELHEQYGIGAALLVPDQILVLEPKAEPVRMVPLFFFIEFLKLAPITLAGSEPMIADRSTDPHSELARKCGQKDLWYEDHPNYPGDGDYRYRNCEALSFVCMFQEPHLPVFPFTISFMKGSYGKGRQFCNLISMRGRPICGCVFNLSVDPVLGKNPKGEWRRFLLANPPERPWVEDPNEYAGYRELHLSLDAAYRSNNVAARYDEEDVTGGATDENTVEGTVARHANVGENQY